MVSGVVGIKRPALHMSLHPDVVICLNGFLDNMEPFM